MQIVGLAGWLLISFLAAAIGGVASVQAGPFYTHRGALSFVDILALWALIVATMIAFWRISPLAGALLVPYLAWVSFASVLNSSVWRLNPQVLG